MEHKRPNGLSQGYFCMRCGGVSGMAAIGHGPKKCESNPELVELLIKINRERPTDLKD